MNINELKNNINDIITQYLYEFNTERVRNEMCYKISQLINYYRKLPYMSAPKSVSFNILIN